MPTYLRMNHANGLRTKKPYNVKEAIIDECPKSVILRDGGWAFQLAHQFLKSEEMGIDFGEATFGKDTSEWPAWAEHVIGIFKKQQRAIERARDEDIAQSR